MSAFLMLKIENFHLSWLLIGTNKMEIKVMECVKCAILKFNSYMHFKMVQTGKYFALKRTILSNILNNGSNGTFTFDLTPKQGSTERFSFVLICSQIVVLVWSQIVVLVWSQIMALIRSQNFKLGSVLNCSFLAVLVWSLSVQVGFDP